MVFLLIIQKFDDKLKEVSELVNIMEQKSHEFEARTTQFLKELEDMAAEYSLPIQPKLALLHGQMVTGRKEEKKKMDRREEKKERKRFALDLLSQAVGCIEEYFQEPKRQLSECEQLCGQIVNKAMEISPEGTEEAIQSTILQTPELCALLSNVKGVAGPLNIRLLLEKTIVSFSEKSTTSAENHT